MNLEYRSADDDGAIDKDEPLKADVRWLGRLLGDTVQAQQGQVVFDLVETIRRTSVQFYRDDHLTARKALEEILDSLDPAQVVLVIRAFSYFSHLANIAEDHHHIRRTRYHVISGSAPRRGTVANALERILAAGYSPADIVAFLNDAQISPVLTAHPTEIRRRSMMHREIAIADLMTRREQPGLTPEERQEIDDRISRAVLVLWQTSLLRQTRLDVLDEVSNGLNYFKYTFFRELPRLYALLEDNLGANSRNPETLPLASFLTIGSWIGGDRDGNPFVTADVLAETMRRQSRMVLDRYLEDIHKLGDELPLSSSIVEGSEKLLELAARSPDKSPRRQAEPYRRAISGIYARLAATQTSLNKSAASLEPVGPADPYSNAGEFAHDLWVIHDSLEQNGSAALTKGRLRTLRRAIDCFGFHLARLDLRQGSDIHAATLSELFSVVEPDVGFDALDEQKRREILGAELRSRRPLVLPRHVYSDQTTSELAILQTAQDCLEAYGDDSIRTAIVSNTRDASDILGLAVLLKQVGLIDG
ncbi:MAG: phosphoenolpyruvate carboxylase, partial [Rhodospirillales bacterium]|nr:phosphoenolpyruvate carboxylase [Rhodospirillales bacterium]